MDLEPNGGAEGGIKNHGLETTLTMDLIDVNVFKSEAVR
jgi:hypothetical protein